MSLELQISADITSAMKAKDKIRLESLRAIKAAILLAKTATAGVTELSDDEVIKIITKLIKQRRESATIYSEQNRAELAEKELAEVSAMEVYMPKQLSPEELEAELKAIIAKVGASAPSDMGKVMGVASKALAGKADGRAISAMVKQLLA